MRFVHKGSDDIKGDGQNGRAKRSRLWRRFMKADGSIKVRPRMTTVLSQPITGNQQPSVDEGTTERRDV